jgi:hypothetical protein
VTTAPGATPNRRRGPGCLGIIGIVVAAIVVAFIVFTVTRPTDESRVAQCPQVTSDLIEAQLGAVSSFATTETFPGNQMKGTATVRGESYEWICSIGITRGNRVEVDVRDADNASVIIETVDL